MSQYVLAILCLWIGALFGFLMATMFNIIAQNHHDDEIRRDLHPCEPR